MGNVGKRSVLWSARQCSALHLHAEQNSSAGKEAWNEPEEGGFSGGGGGRGEVVCRGLAESLLT